MLVLILILHFFILTKTLFTLWPEMVVYPYLINHGFQLYEQIIIPYPPLLIWLLSLFAKFAGYEQSVYQLLTWAIILLVDIILYKTSFATTKSIKLAFVTTTFFVFVSTAFSANGLWFDLVQTPLIVLSTYFMFKYLNIKDRKSLLLTSSFLAITFFIKQQSLWLILFFLSLVVFKNYQKAKQLFSQLILLFIPFVLIGIFIVFVVHLNKDITEFYDWVIYFPFFEASAIPGYKLLPTFKQTLPIIAVALFFIPSLVTKSLRSSFFALTGLIACLFAYPRFDYFHFVPAISVFSLALPFNLKAYNKTKKPLILLSLVGLLLMFLYTTRYFIRNRTDEVRFFDKEITETAQLLKEKFPEGKTVYVQNGPDQLLALANLTPVSPWADEFPWYLERMPVNHSSSLDAVIVKSIELQKPDYVIYKPYVQGELYDLGVYKPKAIADYIDKNYEPYLQISTTLWLKKRK